MTYRKFFASPFIIWILGGTIIPFLVIAYYGFTTSSGTFTWDNVVSIFRLEHIKGLGLSIYLALISTAICFLIAFPLAMILRERRLGNKSLIIFIFILPMWMNILLRTMAWQVLLEKGGVVNSLMAAIGIGGIHIINTKMAVVLGMVYDFLPFMILPIYNVLMRIEDSIIEAAYDLGATKMKVIRSIIFPMSVPGIVSGVTMVFVPALTTFVIPNILGGGKLYLIGNIIEQEFTFASNWNLGSGLSMIMMVFVLITMALFSKLGDERGGGIL